MRNPLEELNAKEPLEIVETELAIRMKEITRLRMLLIRARRQLDPDVPLPENVGKVSEHLLRDIDDELENTD